MLPGIVGGFLATYGWNTDTKGQRGRGTFYMVAGVLTLACYGVVVNVMPWNFSRLMCAYIAVFTCCSTSVGANLSSDRNCQK
jgi:drug/metabolite transporter superfamily protein YnfA